MFRKLLAVLPVVAIAALSIASVQAEDYKITKCPAGKSYCTQTTKPILTPEQAAQADNGISEVIYDPANEARKLQARNAAPYRARGEVPLCPPPHHMTAMDGCQ